MNQQKIVFIAKTDLNTDGRVLNQMDILLEHFGNVFIHFVLLPDKPLKIPFHERVKIYTINCLFRNSAVMRLFTIFEFTVKAWSCMKKIRPDIIHVQDSAAVLPVYLYKMFFPKVKLIYDDHEIPNENASLLDRINNKIESWIFPKSDLILQANRERLDYMRLQHNSINKLKSDYFLNLPYREEEQVNLTLSDAEKKHLEVIEQLKGTGTNFILHQGPLVKERGRELIAQVSGILPENYKILLLGGSKEKFDAFIDEFALPSDKFYFVGTVNYDILSLFWKKAKFSMIFYMPTYINNKLCAPNRFYLSLKYGIPTIINHSNPVLRNFCLDYKCGLFVEDLLKEKELSQFESINIDSIKISYDELIDEEISRFVTNYKLIVEGAK